MICNKVKEQFQYVFVDKYLQIMIYEIALIMEFNKLSNNQNGFTTLIRKNKIYELFEIDSP